MTKVPHSRSGPFVLEQRPPNARMRPGKQVNRLSVQALWDVAGDRISNAHHWSRRTARPIIGLLCSEMKALKTTPGKLCTITTWSFGAESEGIERFKIMVE